MSRTIAGRETSSLPTGPASNSYEGRWFLWLTLAAVITRGIWVLWIHPPGDYVFSDMARYVERARSAIEHGFEPGRRVFAWQAWGTHVLLALPLKLFGKDALWAAALMNAALGAASVSLSYLLACRVASQRWVARAVGLTALLWLPNLSTTGYFLSETPFLCFQLWGTYWLVRLVQEGKRAFGAGIVLAIAFALRPQSAVFSLLAFCVWLPFGRYWRHVTWRRIAALALPMALMLAFSLWRFWLYTGYAPGIAENANMNFTAGRCHNIVTQAFKTQAQLERSERNDNTRDGRRVSIPGYRLLAKRYPPEYPFALRPALESETIRYVGYIGDPHEHRKIRAQCYARTGFVEQLRYGLVNLGLSWFWGEQWPEIERGRKYFYPPIKVYKHLFQVLFLVPSWIGVVLALRGIRRNPGLALLALQLLSWAIVAALFFGDVRLRSPYDPYAFVLAFETLAVWLTRRSQRRDIVTAAATAGAPASGSVSASASASAAQGNAPTSGAK